MTQMSDEEIVTKYYQGWDIKALANEYMNRENAMADNSGKIGKVLARREVARVIFNHQAKRGWYRSKRRKTMNQSIAGIPRPGTQFEYHGIAFSVLGEKQGGVLAIPAEPLREMPEIYFDIEEDFLKSLSRYLNREYIKNFDMDDIIPIVSDFTRGNGNYGAVCEYVSFCFLPFKRASGVFPVCIFKPGMVLREEE